MSAEQGADEARRVARGLNPEQRADILSDKWYLASCDHCGWLGSSRECGVDIGWDDSNVYCPKCHRSGCDMGQVGEQHDAAVRVILAESDGGVSDVHA